jgi:hypothetical protein
MMRYSVFSVISPEGCSAILWNDPTKVEAATKALKITSADLKELDLIDDIIDEPLIGAHRDKEGAVDALRTYFMNQVNDLRQLSDTERLEKRYNRLVGMGRFPNKVFPYSSPFNSSFFSSFLNFGRFSRFASFEKAINSSVFLMVFGISARVRLRSLVVVIASERAR